MLTFWGERYAGYAIEFCLASLFSSENVSYIKQNIKLIDFSIVICTTERDWEYFVKTDIYKTAKKLLEITFLKHPAATKLSQSYDTMQMMTESHVKLVEFCLQKKLYASFLYPDSVLSNNFVELICSHLHSKKRFSFVMHLSVRMSDHRLITDLNQMRQHDGTLNLEPTLLTKLALKSLHPEMIYAKILDSNNLYLQATTSSSFFVTKESYVIFYTISWVPILINYPAIIPYHDISALRNWTLDGDYMDKNASKKYPAIPVTNNLSGILVSFTDTNFTPFTVNIANKFSLPSKYKYSRRFKLVSSLLCHNIIRNRLKRFDIDQLKRKQFFKPVILFTDIPSKTGQLKAKLIAYLYILVFIFCKPVLIFINFSITLVAKILIKAIKITKKLYQLLNAYIKYSFQVTVTYIKKSYKAFVKSQKKSYSSHQNKPLFTPTLAQAIIHPSTLFHTTQIIAPDVGSITLSHSNQTIHVLNPCCFKLGKGMESKLLDYTGCFELQLGENSKPDKKQYYEFGILFTHVNQSISKQHLASNSIRIDNNGAIYIQNKFIKQIASISQNDKFHLLVMNRVFEIYRNDICILKHHRTKPNQQQPLKNCAIYLLIDPPTNNADHHNSFHLSINKQKFLEHHTNYENNLIALTGKLSLLTIIDL